jgi:APA family basic amino acid/polyamine antiporter
MAAPAEERQAAKGSGLFITKPVDALVGDTEDKEHQLQRSVGVLDLTALGLGAIIGTGIFVVIGEAIGDAGPGIIVSFIIAGVTCAFSALAFAELASTIPVAGSAYTYSYATMGELVAWIIGWDLILEYAVSVAAVAVGWGQYFNDLLDSLFGISLPESLAGPPGEGGKFNLPAVFIVLAVTAVLCIGVRESARANSVMVVIKLLVLALFLALGVTAFNSDNFTPFMPEGTDGVVTAASVIFFAYIGFDAVSTAAQEARNPQRDMPIGILGSLLICTILYIVVSLTLTGLVRYDRLNVPHPVAFAVEQIQQLSWLRPLITIGAVLGLGSVVLVMLLGQSRVFYSMSRDGLIGAWAGKVHPRYRTPYLSTIYVGLIVAIVTGTFPIQILGELVNIGTLLAFVLVCAGVLILRRTRPDLERPFRTPLVPLVPILGILACFGLMATLPADTWIRLFVWLVIGFAIYFGYGRKHSVLQQERSRA